MGGVYVWVCIRVCAGELGGANIQELGGAPPSSVSCRAEKKTGLLYDPAHEPAC